MTETREFVWVDSDGTEVIVPVKDHIPYSDVAAIIETVVAQVVKEGRYTPWMEEIALHSCILSSYMGITFETNDELMENVAFTNLTSGYELINKTQLQTITSNIEKMVAHEEKKTGVDRLMDYIKSAVNEETLMNAMVNMQGAITDKAE